MSDEMTINFAGHVVTLERKTTTSGKTLANIGIERAYDHKGETRRETIPVTAWSDTGKALVVGDQVDAVVRVGGREYNGKHYAQLTAVSLSVVAPAQVADAKPVDVPDDTGLPF